MPILISRSFTANSAFESCFPLSCVLLTRRLFTAFEKLEAENLKLKNLKTDSNFPFGLGFLLVTFCPVLAYGAINDPCSFLPFLLIGGKLLLKLMHAELMSRHWLGWGGDVNVHVNLRHMHN